MELEKNFRESDSANSGPKRSGNQFGTFQATQSLGTKISYPELRMEYQFVFVVVAQAI